MKLTHEDNRVVINLDGDFVTDLVNEFRNVVQEQIQAGHTAFVLDFKNTVIIDSMGIGCLVATFNTLKQKNGALELCNVPENLRDVFQVMRLDRILTIN